MRRQSRPLAPASACLVLASLCLGPAAYVPSGPGASAAQQPLPAPWDSVGRILQSPGAAQSGYYRYSFPRSDLTVRIGDVTVATSVALGGWAGFHGVADEATVAGDLVVTAEELGPVQAELARQGIAAQAVHNHLIGEVPQVIYVHFHATGRATELAQRLDRVIGRTGAPRPVRPAGAEPLTVDTAMVFAALGRSGRAHGAVAHVAFTLIQGPVTVADRPIPPALALGSPVNLQSVSAERLVATGDFAITAGQVDPVVRALAEHRITITALHSHLVGEAPTVYFLHFWADGRPDAVLRGLRAAVDAAGRAR